MVTFCRCRKRSCRPIVAWPRRLEKFGAITALSSSPSASPTNLKPGKRTSFPQSVKLKPGETVVFSWIVFKSRAHRDRVNAKVMKDPRLAKMMDPKAMPFDGKRMFWGGFNVLVDA